MIGKKIGAYEIREEVGSGGMATVYRAYQPSVDRHVAVKVIHRAVAGNPETMARFQREARLIARLEHPHILPVFDFDGSHDPPYIVMRYLEGATLREIRKSGPIPLEELALLFRQVSSALDYAHRQGVVHRDIKPSNLLVDCEGNAFVTDFGIARPDQGRKGQKGRTLTQAGSFVGTPAYMAPEQGMSDRPVDHRADVYSLGVVVFETLTGNVPFPDGPPLEVLLAHLNQSPPSLLDYEPSLPPAVDTVVGRALAKDPDDRPATAGELAEELVAAWGGKVARVPEVIRRRARQLATPPDPDIASLPATVVAPATSRPRRRSASGTTPTEVNKQVTALLANLAEWADWADFAEAEALRDGYERLWAGLEEAIVARGGLVYNRTTDAVTALWGATASREDDAERAVRAALDLRRMVAESLGEAVSAEGLPIQVGVNTGEVLLTPREEDDSFTASGTAISLLSRLERAAAPGSIVISEATYRLVRGVFSLRSGGLIRLRGRQQPVATYVVLDAKPRAFRVQSRGVEGIETRMVGRRGELEHLQEAFFTAVEDGETQAVTIVSKPGLGKSRLLFEFINWSELQDVRFWLFQGRAAPDFVQRPYALLRSVVTFRFNIQDSDTPVQLQEKLERGVADMVGEEHGEAVEIAHLLGRLVGFDLGGDEHLPVLADEVSFRDQARRQLVRLFELACARHPVVLQLEDVHWADDSSLDAVGYLLRERRQLPLLAVFLARPELYEQRPAWGSGQSFHSRLDLRPLSKRESRRLVKEILQKVEEVPEALRDLIVDRAEGNPYYMEELVKVLIEERILRKEEPHWQVEVDRLDRMPVPTTLTGLIQARIDSLLPAERTVLQRAAVVGPVFWDRALEAVEAADGVAVEVQAALVGMVRGELVQAREVSAFAGSHEYTFSSSLLRDVVYQSLLARQRRAYHSAVAAWLVAASGERVAERSAEIAEHYLQAHEPGQAAHYLGRAGWRALEVSAYPAAASFFSRALACQPQESGRRSEEIGLLVGWGEALRHLGEYERAEERLESARRLAEEVGDAARQADALSQLAQVAVGRGALPAAADRLRESLRLAAAANDRAAQARALYGLGDVAWRRASFDEARGRLEESLELARSLTDPVQTLYILNRLGTVAMFERRLEAAEDSFQECRSLARRLGNRERLAAALVNLGVVRRLQRDDAGAREMFREALKLARAVGEPTAINVSLLNLGVVAARQGKLEEARRSFSEALQRGFRLQGVSLLLSSVVGFAVLAAEEGDEDRALQLLGLALGHPGIDSDVRMETDLLLEGLRARLPAERIEAGLAAGRELDLTSVAEEILSRGTG